MASKNLFKTLPGKLLPRADAVNAEGAPAYAFDSRHALAQYAATGCLSSTFYASGEAQLAAVLALCSEVEPEFIARTAVFARGRARMKDLPALLLAVLSVKSPQLLEAIFLEVADTPRMLRNFVQIVRSGAVGRKSLGSVPKRLVLRWLEARTDEELFAASVGNSPSLADVLKMVHPRPATPSRAALYGYLLGRRLDSEAAAALPRLVRDFEAYKADRGLPAPAVPFEMLTAIPLSTREWVEIARRASWQMTRMNLNTFARHGVFSAPGLAELIAGRLQDAALIARSKALPYQLLAAHATAGEAVPLPVSEALQDAMEIALANVPQVAGKLYVLVDVSGSMRSPVTGHRAGATSIMRCVDVAALVAAALVRKNPLAEVIPFEEEVLAARLNPRDSVMTNARLLASLCGGGTNCSAPLRLLNQLQAAGDLVVYVSDNESWVDAGPARRGTATLAEWELWKQRNPRARLVCIDIQPNATTQAAERDDVINVGGFSDQVFQVLADVATGAAGAGHWVRQIEQVPLPPAGETAGDAAGDPAGDAAGDPAGEAPLAAAAAAAAE